MLSILMLYLVSVNSHGIKSYCAAGDVYCESQKKCLPLTEKCTLIVDPALATKTSSSIYASSTYIRKSVDDNGCLIAGGYEYCVSLRRCILKSEKVCPYVGYGDKIQTSKSTSASTSKSTTATTSTNRNNYGVSPTPTETLPDCEDNYALPNVMSKTSVSTSTTTLKTQPTERSQIYVNPPAKPTTAYVNPTIIDSSAEHLRILTFVVLMISFVILL